MTEHETLRLVRFVRYARKRIAELEAEGRDTEKWRSVFHQLVQILRGILTGETPPEGLTALFKFLDRFALDGGLHADGGPGSGNWGHEGRPGYVGGSASGGGAHKSSYSSEAKERAKAKEQSKAGGGSGYSSSESSMNDRIKEAFKFKENGKSFGEVGIEMRKLLGEMPVGSKVVVKGTEYEKTGDGEFSYEFKPGVMATTTTNGIANSVNPFDETTMPKFEEIAGATTSGPESSSAKAEAPSFSPEPYRGKQVVDIDAKQFQSLREELQNNTGKAVSNEELKSYLDAVDEYRGTDYTKMVAASAGFGGVYADYSAMMDNEDRAQATQSVEVLEKFMDSADKYNGQVMRAMGFDVGGEYGNGGWDELSQRLRPGETLDMGHISSWTNDRHTVSQVLSARTGLDDTAEKSVEVVMTCNNSGSGVDIGRFSSSFSQGEVIFGKSQKFRVMDVSQTIRPDGRTERWDVTVEEV